MTLKAGETLGPYEVLAPLGIGGMAEVWRGRDTRLDRNVAIKALPSALAANPQFLARFEREARTISSLNHPHICTLFDLGHEADTHFLVMELLEGESLAERLEHGPLPLAQVLTYGAQIASALDAAHRQGIVHRDLKPGNVMITTSGAKLLDFGLARAEAAEPVFTSSIEGRTEAMPLTEAGTLLGTFQYMAPEQLEGQEADARTDIFALGALLYEMATGQRAFVGSSKTSLIASIVSSQPDPISSVTPVAPPALDHVVARCLEKDPEDRWRSAYDVAGELEWIATAGSQAGTATVVSVRRRSRERLAWILVAVLAPLALLFAAGFLARAPEAPRPVTATLEPPPGRSLVQLFDQLGLALSPDGRSLAFAAIDGDGSQQMWLRELATGTSKPLPGTEGAGYPFWSPDGRYLGFFADGKLKKLDLRGGSPQVLAAAPSGRGATWNQDDVILFAPNIVSAIHRVSAAGGPAAELAPFDPVSYTTHRWPSFLPDGDHFIFMGRARIGDSYEVGQLILSSLSEPQTVRVLIDEASNGQFVEPGYLLYGRGSSLYAWQFDLEGLELVGNPIPIVSEKSSYWEPKNLVPFTASDDGTLAFLPDADTDTTMQWRDRDGRKLGPVGEPAFQFDARISPDGQKIAFVQGETLNDVWIRDLKFDRTFRLTDESGLYGGPQWSPDSSRLLFQCQSQGDMNLCTKGLNDGSLEIVVKSDSWTLSGGWLPGGEGFLYSEQEAETDEDIWLMPVDGSGEPRLVLRTPFSELVPMVSPDGLWMAYESDESGRQEVYVRALSGAGGQWQISAEGGLRPRWRADGRELYYVAPNGGIMVANIETRPVFRPGTPTQLFRLEQTPDRDYPVFEDVTPDGQRFLLNLPVQDRSRIGFRLVTGWPGLLDRAR